MQHPIWHGKDRVQHATHSPAVICILVQQTFWIQTNRIIISLTGEKKKKKNKEFISIFFFKSVY